MAPSKVVLLVVLLMFTFGSWRIGAQEAQKTPLDLPAGNITQPEDAWSPDTICFYGQESEGDAFFWCFDRSGRTASDGVLENLKTELIQAVGSLSPRSEFGLVAIGSSPLCFRGQPVVATRARKTQAGAWIQSLFASGAACVLPAGMETLQISHLSRGREKVIYVITEGPPNGGGSAEDCLLAITNGNWEQTPINTVSLCDHWCSGCGMLEELAEQNHGTFVALCNED